MQINNKYNIKLNEVAVENKWNPDEIKEDKNELRKSKLLRLFPKTNMGHRPSEPENHQRRPIFRSKMIRSSG